MDSNVFCLITCATRVQCNNNNNLLHLYSTFLGAQSALHRKGESPHPPPVCSIHLDDVTARGRPICVFQGRYDTDYYRSSRPITDILNRYTCLV